ncbi:MAG TPA: hypothetical protein VFE03_09195 [Caulobacteraceae bacterium]|nr:hypothetical protein [Caulobacteraceae bacterium]
MEWPSLAGAAALMGALALAGAAEAQVDLVSPETVHGMIDLRLAGVDGERSFVDGGFGKTRFSGAADGDFKLHATVAEAALEWTPRLNWEWSALVDVDVQPGQEKPVDISQAYVLFKPVPLSQTRFQAKFGYFYPPVSLEHDGRFWSVTNTITPSAINSWIGEEVKVLGAEGSVSRDFGDASLSASAALFGFDDTSGTLLTYRGWALHDLKSTAHGEFPLPPLSEFAEYVQDGETYSALEIDKRVGFYARVEWRPVGPVTLDALYYDNRGDKVGVAHGLQWAWRTTFTNVGLSVKASETTRIKGQVIVGRTLMGFPTGDGLFADVVFRSAYGLISHDIGDSTLTGRVDLFDVRDHSLKVIDNNDEHGWSATAAFRHKFSEHADFRLEALRVSSHRPSRALGGLAPRQGQTLLQSSLRLTF